MPRRCGQPRLINRVRNDEHLSPNSAPLRRSLRLARSRLHAKGYKPNVTSRRALKDHGQPTIALAPVAPVYSIRMGVARRGPLSPPLVDNSGPVETGYRDASVRGFGAPMTAARTAVLVLCAVVAVNRLAIAQIASPSIVNNSGRVEISYGDVSIVTSVDIDVVRRVVRKAWSEERNDWARLVERNLRRIEVLEADMLELRRQAAELERAVQLLDAKDEALDQQRSDALDRIYQINLRMARLELGTRDDEFFEKEYARRTYFSLDVAYRRSWDTPHETWTVGPQLLQEVAMLDVGHKASWGVAGGPFFLNGSIVGGFASPALDHPLLYSTEYSTYGWGADVSAFVRWPRDSLLHARVHLGVRLTDETPRGPNHERHDTYYSVPLQLVAGYYHKALRFGAYAEGAPDFYVQEPTVVYSGFAAQTSPISPHSRWSFGVGVQLGFAR